MIEVHEAPKTYRVKLEKLLCWLDGREQCPADGSHRRRLRQLLDGNLDG